MPDPASPQPTPSMDPLVEAADAGPAERSGGVIASGGTPSRPGMISGRVVTLGALRACCAGLLLAGLLPTLLILVAWVTGSLARMSGPPYPDTPLGRDPVRWRFEKSFWYFPLEACPLGFAVGLLGWGAVEAVRARAGSRGRLSPRARTLAGLLVAAYLTTACIWWYSALPETPERGSDWIRHDPIEDDPNLRPLFRAAEREAAGAVKNGPRQLGAIHAYWGAKKQILKEKYGINWRTPAEMNPERAFD